MIPIPPHMFVDYEELSNGGVYLRSVQVELAYRGKGLFKKFLNDLLEEYNSISLECWPTLIPMYKHLGFEEVGWEYDGYLEMIRKRK